MFRYSAAQPLLPPPHKQLARDPFSTAPRYHVTLKPPLFQLRQGEPSAEFFQRLPQLQQRLQQERAESAD